MFVSSYSTYIDTTATKRIQNEKSDASKKTASSSFESKLLQTTPKSVVLDAKLPLNYISNYKALNNQQKLQEQELAKNPAKMKFTKISSMNSAHVAYGDNSKMFSLVLRPKQTIDQTPKLDKNLPTKAQEIQGDFMKTKMINTYISNENYYRITAA